MSFSRVVVIAYGNPLRGDDGLAWRVAERLKKVFAPSDVEILRQQQLVPELAEPISRAKAVIFLDAAAQTTSFRSGDISIVEIGERETARANESPLHHYFSPASLLALAQKLYGATPRAFVATMKGQDFGPGEHLSALVERAIPEFLTRVEKLIRELATSG